jgi:hypothetical protein
VNPGSQVRVSTRGWMAYDVLPDEDGLSHYRYLDPAGVPDVVVSRDVAYPPTIFRFR